MLETRVIFSLCILVKRMSNIILDKTLHRCSPIEFFRAMPIANHTYKISDIQFDKQLGCFLINLFFHEMIINSHHKFSDLNKFRYLKFVLESNKRRDLKCRGLINIQHTPINVIYCNYFLFEM